MKNTLEKQYIKKLKRELGGMTEVKRSFLAEISADIHDYLSQHDTSTFDELCAEFGTPADVAESFVDKKELSALKGRAKKRSKLMICGLSALLVVCMVLIAVFAASRRAPNTPSEETTGCPADTTVAADTSTESTTSDEPIDWNKIGQLKSDMLASCYDILFNINQNRSDRSLWNIEYLTGAIKDIDTMEICSEINVFSSYDYYKAGIVKPRGSILSISIIELKFKDGDGAVYMMPLYGEDIIRGELGIELYQIMMQADTVSELQRSIDTFDTSGLVTEIHVYESNKENAAEISSGVIDFGYAVSVRYTAFDRTTPTTVELILQKSGKGISDPDYYDANYALLIFASDAAQECATVDELKEKVMAFENDFISVENVSVFRNNAELTEGALQAGDLVKGITSVNSTFEARVS